jgi:hypothetical protein
VYIPFEKTEAITFPRFSFFFHFSLFSCYFPNLMQVSRPPLWPFQTIGGHHCPVSGTVATTT